MEGTANNGAQSFGLHFFTLPGRFGSFGVGDLGRLLARKWSPGGRSWEPGGSPNGLKIDIFG